MVFNPQSIVREEAHTSGTMERASALSLSLLTSEFLDLLYEKSQEGWKGEGRGAGKTLSH